jgi:hypothetical protein
MDNNTLFTLVTVFSATFAIVVVLAQAVLGWWDQRAHRAAVRARLQAIGRLSHVI